MKVLAVTEKCDPIGHQRDGGARVIDSLREALGKSLKIMQFGKTLSHSATWHFDYPFDHPNRFNRRIHNGPFIARKIKEVEEEFSHILFIHLSMQFDYLGSNCEVWTFPMLLTPSYTASGEHVPPLYLEKEKRALRHSNYILTPSHMEKKQLLETYQVPSEKIRVVPRGISMAFLNKPKQRVIQQPLNFCSVGSIKPQKNTLELLTLFEMITKQMPGACLDIIGPVQDLSYGREVRKIIREKHLNVSLTEHLPPHKLFKRLEHAHFHLSTARCETFGRSIFETLASGLPNLILDGKNASKDFLSHLPYIHYAQSMSELVSALDKMICQYKHLSQMALEIGTLYEDSFLSRLLIGTLQNKETIIISDYDGTLYHKEDQAKTEECIEAFNQYSQKVICSARGIDDLLREVEENGIQADWIIGGSGAIVTDGKGELLWIHPLPPQTKVNLTKLRPMQYRGQVYQFSAPASYKTQHLGLRCETYGETLYFSEWKASKLHAALRLLKHIEWKGNVEVRGDGPYDMELITFFDGTLVNQQQQEKLNV